jgi:hypothetical protein
VGQIRRGKIRAEAFLVAPRRQFESLYSQQNPNLSRQLMHSSEAFLSDGLSEFCLTKSWSSSIQGQLINLYQVSLSFLFNQAQKSHH